VTPTPEVEATRALNHFNLIRMVAALAVLVSHSFPLATGRGNAEPLHESLGISLGSVAVDVFFVCSGFLVTGSLLRQPSLAAFARARALRIYPGLLVVVLTMVIGGGLVFSRLPFPEFLATPATWTFTAKNAVMFFGFYSRLPGVFESNPHALTVNGSLWSLPYEVRLYLLLGALGWACARLLPTWPVVRKLRWVATCIALAALGTIMLIGGAWEDLPPGGRFLWMFFAGATAWVTKLGRQALRWTMLAGVALALAISNNAGFNLVYAIALPVIVLGLAHGRNRWLAAYNRLGDYSYGTYLLAFPVQQSMMALYPEMTPSALSAWAFGCTAFGAVLLWHGVESPALEWRRNSNRPRPLRPAHATKSL
jgi:peptidoglycan/LPS O-acetylase OafA/YrhL